MPFDHSEHLRQKSHRLIPGGCHTYAKGDDQYPKLSPGFIRAGRGCHVWDVDGNEYIEYGMGLRSVTLGHAFPAVVDAVARQLTSGSNFTRPSPIEVECAERFLSFTGNAEMVKFAKDGSTVTTAAVRLARAFTGRDLVATCADDPFISYNDWFIGTTTMRAGIPQVTNRLVLSFRYNDLGSVERLFHEFPRDIACLIFEFERTQPPQEGFLQGVRDLCSRHGTLLIADEMITGFRWPLGGAQKCHGVRADLATFGKGLANGFSVSALAGRREIMELGGLHHDEKRVFLLSTTHGAETHALAAAMATMQVYEQEDVIGHLDRQGRRLQAGARQAAEAIGVAEHFAVVGKPCNLVYVTRDQGGTPSQAFRALFLQELIRNGVLAPSFVVSYSHTDEDIDRTIDAIASALRVYRLALEHGIDRYLVGPPVRPVFARHG